MNCPKCRDAMIALELNQVEVDFCLDCKGIWLDSGELEMLLGDTDQARDFIDSFTAAHTTEEARSCPECGKQMQKVCAQEHRAPVIDRCLDHGIWFDQNELQEMIKLGSSRFNIVLELLEDIFAGRNRQKSDSTTENRYQTEE